MYKENQPAGQLDLSLEENPESFLNDAAHVIHFINAEGKQETISLGSSVFTPNELGFPTKKLSGKRIKKLSPLRELPGPYPSPRLSINRVGNAARIFEDFDPSTIKHEWNEDPYEPLSSMKIKLEEDLELKMPVTNHQSLSLEYLMKDSNTLDQLRDSFRKRSFEFTDYQWHKDYRTMAGGKDTREEFLSKRAEPEYEIDLGNEKEEEEEIYDEEGDEDYEPTVERATKQVARKRVSSKRKTVRKTSRKSSPSASNCRSRGSYNMLSLYKRIEITNYAAKHGIEAAHKKYKLCKSRIKRYQRNGPDRKKGGGRKTLDPNMEVLLLDWIRSSTIESQTFPTRILIKERAKELSKIPDFLASKGWCDKFFKRNYAKLEKIRKLVVQ